MTKARQNLNRMKRRIHRRNRRVRAENAAFESMTKAEKRVRIAKDVLEHIESKKIIPTNGLWLSDTGSPNRRLFEGKIVDPRAQMKDLLPESVSCNACAVGALLYCTVMRVNDLTVRQIGLTVGTDRGVAIVDFTKIKRYLKQFFTKIQLDMMESAFEKRSLADRRKKVIVRAGRMFTTRVRRYGEWEYEDTDADDELRLTTIMQNVVDNGGTFKPKRYIEA